jgi:hypothetical protein
MKTTRIFNFVARMDDENGRHASKASAIHLDVEYTR